MKIDLQYSLSLLRGARDAQKRAGVDLGRLSTFKCRNHGRGNPTFEIYSSDRRGFYVALVAADNAYQARADYIISKVDGTPLHNVQLTDAAK